MIKSEYPTEFYKMTINMYGTIQTYYYMLSYLGKNSFYGLLQIVHSKHENQQWYEMTNSFKFPLNKNELTDEFKKIKKTDFIAVAKEYIEYVNNHLIDNIINEEL